MRFKFYRKTIYPASQVFSNGERIGTYTGKVPIYNATKALKGATFFLPIPLQDTIDKPDTVGLPEDSSFERILPDSELYVIIDG